VYRSEVPTGVCSGLKLFQDGVVTMYGRIQNTEGPLFSHIGLESWVYGFEKLCHSVPQNCFRYAKWPGVVQVIGAHF
jgi:hypothetical protein